MQNEWFTLRKKQLRDKKKHTCCTHNIFRVTRFSCVCACATHLNERESYDLSYQCDGYSIEHRSVVKEQLSLLLQ